MALLPEAIDFTAGQTLNKRVASGDPRMYRRVSGYRNDEGPLTPDYFPDLVSEATALTGTMPEQVILAFRDASGLRFLVRDADSKVRVMATDGTWSSAGPVFDVIKDSAPFKIGPTGVFPTLNGLWSYEPDSPTRKYRPFSLKSPRNYDKDYQITVTPSVPQELQLFDLGTPTPTFTRNTTSTNQYGETFGDSLSVTAGADTVLLWMGWGGAEEDIPVGTWIFNYNIPTDGIETLASAPTAGGTGYSAGDLLTLTEGTGGKARASIVASGVVTAVTLVAGGNGYSTGSGKATTVSPSGGTGCTLNISAIDAVSFTGKDFLVIDMSMGYTIWDPTERIVESGAFINAPILASGLEIAFYSAVNGSGEISRHAIPQIKPDGKVHRVAIHLGDMNSTTVKCIRILTASYWKAPQETTSFELRLYSEDYDESWEYKGNVLEPAVKFSYSPWCNTLPRSPGDKPTTGVAYPTSAIVLETFPENMVNFTPDHPRVKWNYIHRARSYLSTDEYDQQLSNPSLDSAEYFADPWRLYQLDVAFPTNADSDDVLDDYANYVTHGIFYRELYSGLGLDDIVLRLGVWSGGEYVDKSIIKSAVACTTVDSGDKITSTAHGLSLNDVVEFSATLGGVVVGTHYYVRSIADADTFQISATRGGSAFTIDNTAGANTWTTAALSRDDLGRIDYPVTMDDSDDDLVDAAVHRLRVGDIITLGLSVGGVKKATNYYVITTTALDHFQISLTPDGSAVGITADIANTWSHAGKVLAIGEHIIPDQIELNHDFAGSAKHSVVADDRVYLGHLTHTGYAVTCTMNDSGDTVTCTSHGLGINDKITFTGTTGGVATGTTYYVVTVADDDTFQFSATLGGGAFTITADGANSWTGVWTQPLHMRVSNAADYSSFPTTPRTSTDRVLARSYLAVDGQELGKFSPDAYELRGILVKNDVKFAFTEKGFGEVVGSDASTPWAFLNRDIIGLKSAKTLADCRSQMIWHGPSGGTDRGSYFHSYAGGLAVPISKGIVDSSLIDWTKAHQGVFSNERYVFFCYYDDSDEETAWCLWVYNLMKPGWRSTHSEAYEFAGMCVDESTGDVYALTHDGDIVNVFGQLDMYGDDEAVRTVEWQHVLIAGPDKVRTTSHVVADIITDEDSIEMELTVSVQGQEDNILDMQLQTITSGQTQYRWPIGVTGDAVKVKLVYRGATPPDEISDLRVDVNPPQTA